MHETPLIGPYSPDEVVAWRQLGQIRQPIGLLDVHGNVVEEILQ